MKRSIGARTLAMPTPLWLVGTYDADGRPDIAAIAWGGICNSQPPALAVSLRAARHTHAAILARRAFTVSIPSESQAIGADFAGMASGRDTDKFAAAGWTAVRGGMVDAPYVGEAPLVVECSLLTTVELGTHTQFIGEIVDVKADEAVLGDKDHPDIARVRPLIYDPAQGNYHGVGASVGKAYGIGRVLLPSKPE